MSPASFIKMTKLLLISITIGCATSPAQTNDFPGDVLAPWEGGPAYYSQWENGPSPETDFFPIAVWLQSPEAATAKTYKNIGVNTFVGLYSGPTEAQLKAVASLNVATICDQNSVALASKNNAVIKSWLQQDEPDDAQGGTQDPVPTAEVVARYNEMKSKDASRPVYLNLGQGVACNAWYGRGNRTNHPEDYPAYSQGADILSYDTYPMNVYPLPASDAPWFRAFHNVLGQNIWFVANGVDSLRKWTDYAKPVWVWIESTNINGDSRYKLTPAMVKAEVWMAIIHGARGIGYFCHQFSPTFIEAGLLANPQIRNEVAAVNAQITALAPVLNTQSVANGAVTVSGNAAVIVDNAVKRFDGFTYLFAVAVRPGTTTATFSLRDFGNAEVEVIGESRKLTATAGVFQDEFANYAVHIYKVPNSSAVNVGQRNNSFQYALCQNYSNPFNNSTTIEYSIPVGMSEAGLVTLKIYDVLGREAATLVNERLLAGNYRVNFNPDQYGLAGGVWVYALKTERNVEYKKMIYLK